VVDVLEVLEHWQAGRPKLVIAESLGLDVKTVRKYVAPAEEAGIVPGGAPLGRAQWAELAQAWFPGLVDARVAPALREPYASVTRRACGACTACRSPRRRRSRRSAVASGRADIQSA